VGNGDGVTVTSINVDVGTGVGETTVGTGASVGRVIICLPQAGKKARRTIQANRRKVSELIIKNLLDLNTVPKSTPTKYFSYSLFKFQYSGKHFVFK
jgi:hypothetical protein